MVLDLVLDIGNSKVKGAFFEGRKLVHAFSVSSLPVSKEEFFSHLSGKQIRNTLVSSVHSQAEETIKSCLEQQKIPFIFLDYSKLKLILDVDEPDQLGHDRIANAYGALAHFPINDCIVIDIGTAITADFVAKEGRYVGGMIYLGAALCAKALAEFTDKLPLVSPQKPPSALAKTTQTHLQGGIYYGQLGAIERLIDELRVSAPSPGSVKIIATGGAARPEETSFASDLQELVDLIDPHLTLLGLHEILSEIINKE